jgi:hypothetical protein
MLVEAGEQVEEGGFTHIWVPNQCNPSGSIWRASSLRVDEADRMAISTGAHASFTPTHLDSAGHTTPQGNTGIVHSNDNRSVPEVLKNDNLGAWNKTQGSHAF